MQLTWFLIGMGLVAVFTPFGVAAVRHAKRRRGGAIAVMGLLLMFGMNMQITPPPPPQTEQIQRQAEDDEGKA
jgi:hypothetical protein